MTNIQDQIDNICDVNGSWREELSKAGVLLLLDQDTMLDGTVFTDYLVEEYDLTEDQAARELDQFVRTRMTWNTETLVKHMSFALEYIQEFGLTAEEAIDTIFDYNERCNDDKVFDALTDVLIEGEDNEELFDAYLERCAD